MVCTRNMHWRLAVDNDHVLKPAGGGIAAVRPGQGYGRQSHQSRGPTKPHHPEKTAGLLEAQTHGYDQGTARCVDGELDCPESLPQNQSRSIVTSGRSHASTHAGDAASGVSGKFQPGAQGKQEGALQIKSKLKTLMDLWQAQPMREAPAPHSVNGGTHSSDIGLAQLPAHAWQCCDHGIAVTPAATAAARHAAVLSARRGHGSQDWDAAAAAAGRAALGERPLQQPLSRR